MKTTFVHCKVFSKRFNQVQSVRSFPKSNDLGEGKYPTTVPLAFSVLAVHTGNGKGLVPAHSC